MITVEKLLTIEKNGKFRINPTLIPREKAVKITKDLIKKGYVIYDVKDFLKLLNEAHRTHNESGYDGIRCVYNPQWLSVISEIIGENEIEREKSNTEIPKMNTISAERLID